MRKTRQRQSPELETLYGVALHQRLDPKCANPACPVVFHWLTGGKFFRFADGNCQSCDNKRSAESTGNERCGGHCVKHFWLCERCSNVFTVVYRKPEGVIVELLRDGLPEGEAADESMVAAL